MVIHFELNVPAKYLLAVSGGSDSMALLHYAYELHQADPRYGFEVAHVDHALRTSSSDDAKFVEAESVRRGFTFHLKTLSHPPTENIENWARQERYRFFRVIMQQHALTATLTAHTKNDLIETFLMRLVTNKDLRLIARRDEGLGVVRPLLECTKETLQTYLKEKNVDWREDETNEESSYLRNRVRNKLLPFIAQHFDGDPIKLLGERVAVIEEDQALIDELVRFHCARLPSSLGSKEWLRTLLEVLKEVHTALQWRIIEEIVYPVCKFRIGRKSAQRVIMFLHSGALAIELPGKLVLKRKEGGLLIK